MYSVLLQVWCGDVHTLITHFDSESMHPAVCERVSEKPGAVLKSAHYVNKSWQ